MESTESAIFGQFEFWAAAPAPAIRADASAGYVVVGCGSSYNLAMSVAVALNERGFRAIPVPGNEWVQRPRAYKSDTGNCQVIAISRSGETSEVVRAAEKSRADGLKVIAVTCDRSSALARAAHHVLAAETHPDEGVVMSASASLMLMLALRFAGIDTNGNAAAAETLLHDVDRLDGAFLVGRTHFIYLGGGGLYGIAAEGALKLEEMSLTATEFFHPLEYRHGPISVLDDRSLVVMLYHPDTRVEEERLAQELSSFGAFIVGLGGAGDVSLSVGGTTDCRGLVCLPALQLLGAQMARLRRVDATAPRHLTKVVKIA